MTISPALSRLHMGISRSAQASCNAAAFERLQADSPATQGPARICGVSQRAINRAGLLLRCVGEGFSASGQRYTGPSCGSGNVAWAASRFLCHLSGNVSGNGTVQCGTWRKELRHRERELDLACRKEVARWRQLNRAIESLCRLQNHNGSGFQAAAQSDGAIGQNSRIDGWLSELDELVKARHLAHRRLSFLQQEHDNIARTLSAFEVTTAS